MTTSLNSQRTPSPSGSESTSTASEVCPSCQTKDCLAGFERSGIPLQRQTLDRNHSIYLKNRRVAKESFGLQQSPEINGGPQSESMTSPLGSPGLKDSLKEVSPDTSIGNLSLRQELSQASRRLRRSLGLPKATSNSHVQKKLKLTAGKMTLHLDSDLRLENDGNYSLELNPFEETRKSIGKLSTKMQSKAISSQSRQTFEWLITGPYAQLVHTILLLNQFEKKFTTSGGQLTLESRTGLGTKQVWMLSARIRDPSGGMVTKVNEMLLWMNFEEELISHISSDGSTGILLLWKTKVQHLPSTATSSGSPVICPLTNYTSTIQKWTRPPWMLFDEE